MPLDKFPLELFHFLLWIVFIFALLVILVVVLMLHQLSQRQETGHPVETADDYPASKTDLKFPIQETQKPGIHPSNASSEQKKQFTMRLESIKRQDAIYQDLLQNQSGSEGAEEQERQELVAPQQLLGDAASTQMPDNKSELGKCEEGETSPVTEAAPNAEPGNNVPGDVNDSQDPASLAEATVAQPSPGDEKPSGSNTNAATLANSTHKKRKRRSRRKKKNGSKESLAEAGSSEDEVAAVEDPETSTDESHHSSIEAFSSVFHGQADGKDPKEQTDSQEAAARQDFHGNCLSDVD